MRLAQEVAPDPGLSAFYGAHQLKPVFVGAEAAPRRAALIDAIATAPEHGLPPARYDAVGLSRAGQAEDVATELLFARALSRWADDVSNGLVEPSRTDSMNKRQVVPVDMAALLDQFTRGDPARALDTLPPQDPTYLRLKDMLSDQARLVAPAGTPEVAEGLYKRGVSGPDVANLRARLAAIGFTSEAAGDEQLFDDSLADAVSRYQDAAGLPVDGVAGPKTLAQLNGTTTGPQTRRLMIAMERMRWLNGHDLNARMIWVNIPSYIVEIREGGDTVFQTRSVVGQPDPDWETPEFSDTMEFVVPSPVECAALDHGGIYLPKLKADRNAVSHLEVVDRKGHRVSRENIDFGKYTGSNFPYYLRQKPSADNALGRGSSCSRTNAIFICTAPRPKAVSLQPCRVAWLRAARDPSIWPISSGSNSDDPRGYFQRVLDQGEPLDQAERAASVSGLFHRASGPGWRAADYRDVYGRDATLWQAMRKAAEAGS